MRCHRAGRPGRLVAVDTGSSESARGLLRRELDEGVLAELYHILKPGGLLLCNIPGFDDGVAGHDMHALGADTFLYQSAYFYRFLEPEAAEGLLSAAGFEVLHSGRREWLEAAHPGYRKEDHTHVSHVLLVRRPTARTSG